MKYMVVKNDRSHEEQYFVMRKKNWYTRWKYVRNELGLISFWTTESAAKRYIEQQLKTNN